MRSVETHETRRLLEEQVRGIERGRGLAGQSEVRLGGPIGPVRLACGIVHEWFAADGEAATRPARSRWVPPLCLLAHAARLALRKRPGAYAVWLGRTLWPSVRTLVLGDDRSLLHRSVFVDPPDAVHRLWATDAALRCPAVAAVIADGSGLNMAATRRLQLAAAAGGALALLARPLREVGQLSAAGARWLVRPEPSETSSPRWSVELLRCKGVQPTREEPRRWAAVWDHAHGVVVVPADLAHRPAAEERSAPARAGPLLRTG